MPEIYQETDTNAIKFKSYIEGVTDHQSDILPLIDQDALPAARPELEALCGAANRALRDMGYIGADAIIHKDAVTHLPTGRDHILRRSASPVRGRYEGLTVMESGTIGHQVVDSLVDPRYCRSELSRYAFAEIENEAFEVIKPPEKIVPEKLRPHSNEIVSVIEQSSLKDFDDIWQHIREICEGNPDDKTIDWFFDKLESRIKLQNMTVICETPQIYICEEGYKKMSYRAGPRAEIMCEGEFAGFTTTPDFEVVETEDGTGVVKVHSNDPLASLAIAIDDGEQIVKIPVKTCKDLTCVEDVIERARE